MLTIAKNKLTDLPCFFMFAHISRKQLKGGDEVSVGTTLGIILPLLFTFIFMFFSEQNIKTFGELALYVSNISIIAFSTLVLIFALLLVSITFFVI